jgi:hypothetical protein
MQNSLSASSSGGTQTTTQNPQAATSDSNLTSGQSNLQAPQINLFNSTNGISLKPTSASAAVTLQSTKSTGSTEPLKVIRHHHVNGVLLAIVIVVFVAAITTFWQTFASAKSTTD